LYTKTKWVHPPKGISGGHLRRDAADATGGTSYRPKPLTEMKGNEIEARGPSKLNAATLRRVEDRKQTGFSCALIPAAIGRSLRAAYSHFFTRDCAVYVTLP
jgi:hypothetical protein